MTKGVKLSDVLVWFTVLLCIAGLFVANVWRQNAFIHASKENIALRKQVERLESDVVGIQMEIDGLRDNNRLETLARDRFGLAYAGVPVPVYSEGKAGKK